MIEVGKLERSIIAVGEQMRSESFVVIRRKGDTTSFDVLNPDLSEDLDRWNYLQKVVNSRFNYDPD